MHACNASGDWNNVLFSTGRNRSTERLSDLPRSHSRSRVGLQFQPGFEGVTVMCFTAWALSY